MREPARRDRPQPRPQAPARPIGSAPAASGERLDRLSAFYASGPAVPLAAPGAKNRPAVMEQKPIAMGRPGDRWEREADAVAEKVTVGQPAPQVSRLSIGAPDTRRLAAEPAAPSRAGRDEEVPEVGPEAGDLAAVQPRLQGDLRSLRGTGEPLPAGARASVEGSFHRDFGEVRIHRDARAAGLAVAIGARAFTMGRDIAFAAGEYAPETRPGRHLLAHELAHVAQGSDSGGPPSHLHRFGSEEHRQLGHEATGGATTDLDIGTPASPQKLTYGEMVALAGDYFQSLVEMRVLAETNEGRAQLLWARWWALGAGAEPAVSEAIKQAVRDRYFTLAARNISHFSAGGTARNEYQRYHREALELAFRSGIHPYPSVPTAQAQSDWEAARTTEAFGHHFLTDMFSAGHVRTPRSAIRTWYQARFPNSVDQFVAYMARHMRAYLQQAHPWGDFFGQIPDQADLESRIRILGGAAIGSFSLGDVVSLAFHNRDNAGLRVRSDVDESGTSLSGGFRFTAMGDRVLSFSTTTRNMVLAAMRASLGDLDAMRRAAAAAVPPRPVYSPGPWPNFAIAFGQALATLTPYAAERYIPREDTSAGNVALIWQWGSFNAEMRSAVQMAIRHEIVATLRERARLQTDANVRDALNDFATHLDLQGIQAIESAVGVPAGP